MNGLILIISLLTLSASLSIVTKRMEKNKAKQEVTQDKINKYVR